MGKILIDSVVFDLDGTLWDTSATCAMGWNRVLERLGIPFRPITEHDVRGVTGTPHEQCIRDVFAGLPEAHLVALAVETAVEDVRLIGERGGDLFPDVDVGLRRLAARYPLFIVSNCQAGYIETFQGWSGLGAFFRDFECWGNTGLTKPANLKMLIERTGSGAPSSSATRPAIRPRRGSAACRFSIPITASAAAPMPRTASPRSTR